MKIYVAAVETLRNKERQGETQETIKIDSFLSFAPTWMLMYFFAGSFWISPCVHDQLRVLGAVFSWLHGYLYYVTRFGGLFSCIFRFFLDGKDEITCWFHFWLCKFHLWCESTVANKHDRYGKNWRSMFTFWNRPLPPNSISHYQIAPHLPMWPIPWY